MVDFGVLDSSFLAQQGTMAFIAVILAIIVLKSSLSRQSEDGTLSHLSRPPQKPGWPLLGNVEFVGEKGHLFNSCSGLTTIRVLGQDIVIVSNPELAEQIHRVEGSCIDIRNNIPTARAMFGENSFLHLHGEQHKRLRNAFLPNFRPSNILSNSLRIQSTTSKRLGSWAQMHIFAANSEIQDFAFELGMSFVGVNYQSMSLNRRKELRQAACDVLTATLSFPIDLGKYSQFGRGVLARKKLLEVLLEATRTSQATENKVVGRVPTARDANGDALSTDAVLDNLLGFSLGAIDTTCSALTSFVLNMCRYPEVQETAHARIREALGEDSDEYNGVAPIRDSQWEKLEYIEQVVFETQRFDPAVSTTSFRSAIKDFELGGHIIKKGTRLIEEVVSRSRSSKYWTNPNEFDPDRFHKRHSDHRRRVSQLGSFGGGSRQCIAKGFAAFQLKVVATIFLRDYKIEFADAQSVPNVIYPLCLELDGPLRVTFVQRQKSFS